MTMPLAIQIAEMTILPVLRYETVVAAMTAAVEGSAREAD
jgi:hypothetical protein